MLLRACSLWLGLVQVLPYLGGNDLDRTPVPQVSVIHDCYGLNVSLKSSGVGNFNLN